jgi:hypothetical protein
MKNNKEIPKSIKMFGYDWKLIIDKNNNCDCGYNWGDYTIKLDEKWWQEELIHEICEAILTNLYYRYSPQEGGMEKMFIFNHTGLCQFHKKLYQILKDNNLII